VRNKLKQILINKRKLGRREETVQSSPASAFFVFFIYSKLLGQGKADLHSPFAFLYSKTLKKERNCACEHCAGASSPTYEQLQTCKSTTKCI
jgi:hypothetical protein